MLSRVIPWNIPRATYFSVYASVTLQLSSILIGFETLDNWQYVCTLIYKLYETAFFCVRLYFRICTKLRCTFIQAWRPGETFSISSPPTYLVNIVAIHTDYQLHEIVADFLGQRTSAEAQFDESSQESPRKKIKSHVRVEFLRKSIGACC